METPEYDAQMSTVSDCMVLTTDPKDIEALEKALDAMAFVKLMHASMAAGGAKLSPEPDTDEVGTYFDCILGEISAASLFLNEASFARVPEMLRKIADAVERKNAPWTDPSGYTEPPVAPVVIQGFRNFADRLDATKIQARAALQALKKVGV